MTTDTRAGTRTPARGRGVATLLLSTGTRGVHEGLGRGESAGGARRAACRASGRERRGSPGALLQARVAGCLEGRGRRSSRRARTARSPSRARKASAAALAVTTARTASHRPSAADATDREWVATLCSIDSCTSRKASPTSPA